MSKASKIRKELRLYRKALGLGVFMGTFQGWIEARKGGHGERWNPINKTEAALVDAELEREREAK